MEVCELVRMTALSDASTVEDLDAIRTELPTVAMVSPGVQSRAQIVFGNQNWNTRIEGDGSISGDQEMARSDGVFLYGFRST